MSKKTHNPGFSDVDQTADPQWFVDCLDRQHALMGQLQQNKQTTLACLDVQPGHIVLDAGCGTGVDALQMARLVGDNGHVFGIDYSHEMIASAQSRTQNTTLPITCQQNDIYRLDFGDDTFDRCRSDKTFQHLADPRRALAELIRVTKPGGKIVIADPDHDSLLIDTPYTGVNRRFVQFRSDHMTQGGIAHRLYGMFKELGLTDVTAVPLTGVFTDYEEKSITSPYLEEIRFAQEQGIVTAAEADQWVAYLEAAIEEGRFFCLQTVIITMGFKPPASS